MPGTVVYACHLNSRGRGRVAVSLRQPWALTVKYSGHVLAAGFCVGLGHVCVTCLPWHYPVSGEAHHSLARLPRTHRLPSSDLPVGAPGPGIPPREAPDHA